MPRRATGSSAAGVSLLALTTLVTSFDALYDVAPRTLRLQRQTYRTVIAAHDVRVDVRRNHSGNETLRNQEIVNTPPDISCTRVGEV